MSWLRAMGRLTGVRGYFRFLSTVVLLATGSARAADGPFEWVLHDGLEPDQVRHLEVALQEARPRVLAGLGLEDVPSVHVQIWADEEAYQAVMKETFGSRAPGSRGYITGNQEVRLLYHTMLSAQREAVHEFTHVASLHVNPDFANNPRWLWEAVAIYLAGEYVSPQQSGLFGDDRCPSLELLNSPFDRGGTIYSAGYLLGDFIDKTWGRETFLQLIKNNGDVGASLELSDEVFEQRWCTYVRQTYGSEHAAER